MRPLTLLLLLCVSSVLLTAQSRPLYRATQHSIGYTVPLQGSAGTDTTLSLALRYRKLSTETYLPAPHPVRCVVRKVDQFRGSVLLLEPATAYVVEAMFTSATGRYAPFIDTIVTLPEPEIRMSDRVMVVSPTGSGTDYTTERPGDLRTLLDSGIQCGTTVLLKGGRYPVGWLTLTLPTTCDSASQIVIQAWPGDSVIFDGGTTVTTTWTPVPGEPGMYSTALPELADFTSLCTFDGQRLYPYALRQPNALFPSYPTLHDLGYDVSGFYRDSTTLYVKMLDGTDPSGHDVVVSNTMCCLNVVGKSSQAAIVVSNIHFQNYGAAFCTRDEVGIILECYPLYTLQFENVNNAIVDGCSFSMTNAPIGFNGACNNNTVRNCSIIDGTGYWSHGAFKQTRDHSIVDQGSYGRYLELSAISFAPGDHDSIAGNSVHHNTVQGVVGGITAGWISNNAIVSDHDVYDNLVQNCYDGIDCIGGAGGGTLNARIWGNRILDCPVGTSLISNTYQVTYILRNVYRIADRRNHNNDVFFMNCDNSLATSIWSTALKLNAGDTTRGRGAIHFVHNTVVSEGQFGFGLYLWQPTWSALFMRNNIFTASNAVPLMFDGIANERQYAFDGDGDVYFAEGQSSIATIRPVHGVAGCQTVASPDALRAALVSTTQSPLISIGANSIRRSPDFVNAGAGDYRLNSTSGIVDAGVVVDGFTFAFAGAAPDPGAYEIGAPTSVHAAPPKSPAPFNEATIIRTQFFSLIGEELDGAVSSLRGLLFIRETDAEGNVRTRPIMLR